MRSRADLMVSSQVPRRVRVSCEPMRRSRVVSSVMVGRVVRVAMTGRGQPGPVGSGLVSEVVIQT